MAGLLDILNNIPSNPLVGMGVGLLGAAGPSPHPIGMGQALQQGLLGMRQAQAYGAHQQAQQAKQEEAARKAEEEKQAIEKQRADMQAAQSYIASKLPDPAQQSAAMAVLQTQGPEAAVQWVLKQTIPELTANQKDAAALEASLGRPLTEAQKLKLYGAAPGGPLVSQTIGGPPVHLPVNEKAREYRMPDGKPPLPTMTVPEILAGGGELLTDAAKKREDTRATLEERAAVFSERTNKAAGRYDSALKSFLSNPLDANARTALENTAHEYQIALGQEANVTGEPSDFVTRGFDVPGPLRGYLRSLFSDFLTGSSGPAKAAPPSAAGQAAPQDPRKAAVFKKYGVSTP